MPNTCFSRANDVMCPLCHVGKLFIEDLDVPDNCKLQLILPNSKLKARWYVKCYICKKQIGIRLKL